MVLKAKKMVKDVKTYKIGDADTRKGPSRRSSKSKLRNKRLSYDHRSRSAIEDAERNLRESKTLFDYYKDLLK